MASSTLKQSWIPSDLHNTKGINPLAGAAAPILTIAYQLSEQASPVDDVDSLISILIVELKSFYHKADSLGYDAKQILAARYWLCSTLDELILNLPNPKKIQPRSLLVALEHPTASHYFFSLVLEHQNTSNPSADLLEMAYLCLCVGYTGQHHMPPTTSIEHVCQQLSNQTQTIRNTKPFKHTQKDRRIQLSHYLVALIVVITLATLITIYGLFHLKIEPLKQVLQLAKNNHLIQTLIGRS